jgi:hypothetical protein
MAWEDDRIHGQESLTARGQLDTTNNLQAPTDSKQDHVTLGP